MKIEAPKLWRDMTDAEKGALLLAHHEGKDVRMVVHVADPPKVRLDKVSDVTFRPVDGIAYCVFRPEPKRETVTLIDGEPDCDSVKMERL